MYSGLFLPNSSQLSQHSACFLLYKKLELRPQNKILIIYFNFQQVQQLDFEHFVYINMKKAEVQILAHIQAIDETNNLLNQIPKSSQQQFLLNYAAIHFINKGSIIPSLNRSLETKSSSFSYLQLKLKFMKKCMEAKTNLENPEFNVLNTLVLWMDGLQKLGKNTQPKLIHAALLPHPQKLKFNFYEEFIVYLNYLAIDIQNLFKSNTNHWIADDLLQFLAYSLPRIHYNIILPNQFLGLESKQSNKEKPKDVLFWNLSLSYFIRVKTYYRSLMKLLIKTLISLELKPTQMRAMIDLVCRYHLLFQNDSRQSSTEIFISAFSKITEAVRFSLTDQLLLFFRICEKLGAQTFLQTIRQKWEWADSLLIKYENNAVGHPKNEIYPYNPLQIRQKLVVEAGKTIEKVLEIYSEYSLFYFSVQVKDLDTNIRLYYLGDFDSNIQIKNLLLSQDKRSSLNRFAFMATKRGLYKIQIDNSYSWINSKKVEFQYVVLSQYKYSEYPQWFNNLFQINNTNFKRERQQTNQHPKVEKKSQKGNKNNSQIAEKSTELNLEQSALQEEKEKAANIVTQQIANLQVTDKTGQKDQKQVKNAQKTHQLQNNGQELIEKKNQIQESTIHPTLQIKQSTIDRENPILQSRTSSEELVFSAQNLENRYEVIGQANLSLIDNIFSLLVSTCDHTYEFETNLDDRIVKRLKSYCQSHEKYQWIVNGQARDWLKKHGFSLVSKKGLTFLATSQSKEVNSSKKNERKTNQ